MSAGNSRIRLWHAVHGWMGLPLWALLLFVCLSGSVAVVSREILWLVEPAVRADAAADALSANALVAAVEAAEPSWRVLSIQRDEAYLAAIVRAARPDGSTIAAWVDPATGAIQGLSDGFAFLRLMRALHGWLLVPTANGGVSLGWYAVCLTAVPLVGTLVTGLVVYKRFWRALYRPRLRLRGNSRVAWGDLHRLGGVWGLWFVLLMAVTGLWFMIQAIIVTSSGPLGHNRLAAQVPRNSLPVMADGQAAPRADLDAAVRAAQGAVPGLRPRRITLPTSAFEPVTVAGGGRVPLLLDQVAVHPYSGAVLGVQLGGDAPPLTLAARIFRALHAGNFGGLPIKLLWLAGGLVLSGLVLSGLMIWRKRPAAKPMQENASHA